MNHTKYPCRDLGLVLKRHTLKLYPLPDSKLVNAALATFECFMWHDCTITHNYFGRYTRYSNEESMYRLFIAHFLIDYTE